MGMNEAGRSDITFVLLGVYVLFYCDMMGKTITSDSVALWTNNKYKSDHCIPPPFIVTNVSRKQVMVVDKH